MKITRTSPLTGKVTTLDLDVTSAQMTEFASSNRRLVQEIFPNLTAAEREFIKTGYTQEDWNRLFPDD